MRRAVIFGAVENDHARDEAILVAGCRKEPATEIFADHGGLDQGGIEEIPGDHQQSGVLLQRQVVRADDVRDRRLRDSPQFSPMVVPVTVRASE